MEQIIFPQYVFYNGSVWAMGYNTYFGTGYNKLTANMRRHPKRIWMHQRQMLANLKSENAEVAINPKPSDLIVDTIKYSLWNN
jgi:hypothetical protein